MKRIFPIIAFVLALFGTASSYAQMRDSLLTHYLGLEAHVGYDNMFTRQSGLPDIGGVGGGLGIVYKLQYRPWRSPPSIPCPKENGPHPDPMRLFIPR